MTEPLHLYSPKDVAKVREKLYNEQGGKDAIWACCLAEADILGVFVDDICTGYHVVFMRLFISFPHSKNGLSVQSVGFLFST